MSFRIAGMIWELTLPKEMAWVLMAMADHADHFGNNMSAEVPLIAWKTDLSVRSVQRTIRALKEAGYLVVQEVRPGKSTVYGIRLEHAPRKLPYVRRERGDISVTPDVHVTPQAHEGVTGLPSKRKASGDADVRGDVGVRGDKMSGVTGLPSKRKASGDSASLKTLRIEDEEEDDKDTKELLLPTRARVDAEVDDGSKKQKQAIFTKFEQNIHALTPIVRDVLLDLMTDYPLQWVEDAVDVAARAAAKNVNYVTKTLQNWKSKGRAPAASSAAQGAASVQHVLRDAQGRVIQSTSKGAPGAT
jgi:DNA-binding transcriptional ArsR family regulator